MPMVTGRYVCESGREFEVIGVLGRVVTAKINGGPATRFTEQEFIDGKITYVPPVVAPEPPPAPETPPAPANP